MMTYLQSLTLLILICSAQAASVIVLPAPGDRTATILDIDTWKPIGSATVGADAFNAFTLPNGSKTYVIAKSSITVLGEFSQGAKVLSTIDPLAGVADAALSSNGRRLLLVSNTEAVLTLINTATDRIMARIPLPGSGNSVSVDHATTQAVVGTAGAVHFIDLNTNTLKKTVAIPQATYAAFAPSGSVYVIAADTLVEIDPRTYTVEASVKASSSLSRPHFTANSSHATILTSDGLWVAGLYPLRMSGPFAAPSPLDHVHIVSDRIAIGYSSAARSFFRIEFQPKVVFTQMTGLAANTFAGMSSTPEDPQSRHLIVINGGEILRTNTRGDVSARLSLDRPAGGVITLAVPSRAPVARISPVEGRRRADLPLVFRALDADGVPVTNRAISFMTGCGDAGSYWTALTTAQGYVDSGRVRYGGCWGLSVGSDLSFLWIDEYLNFAATTEEPGVVVSASPRSVIFETGTEPPLLRVRAVSRSNRPAAGVTITWAFAAGGGELVPLTSPDYRGLSANRFQPATLPPSTQQAKAVVTARGPVGGPVTFTVVTLAASPLVSRLSPEIKATAGETIRDGLRYRITDRGGAGISGIALTFEPNVDAGTVACVNDAVTNTDGVVSCDLFVGSGARFAKVYLGGREVEKLPITITPAAAEYLFPVSGHAGRTSGNIVSFLDPLAAILMDRHGNPVNGLRPSWEGATAIQPDSSTRGRYNDGDGQVESDGLVFARFAGAGPYAELRINARDHYPGRWFEASSPDSFRILDGDDQTAIAGQPFDRPLSVEAIGAGFYKPLLHNVTVGFHADAGLILSANTAVTDTQGRAEVSVMAGSTPGAHFVIATLNGISVRFKLNVDPAPAIRSITGGLTPCGIATVSGSRLALPLSLGGLAPPIQSASAEAVTFQVPCEVPPGAVTLTLGTLTQSITIAPYAPAVFEQNGTANARHVDGTSVSETRPAQPGEEIHLLATGLGQATPSLRTGVPGSGERVNAKVLVGLGSEGIDTETVYAPSLIGIYLVKFRVPATAKAGSTPVGVAVQNPDGSFVYSPPSRIDIR